MSYLSDLFDYLGGTRQTLAGLVGAMWPAVGQLEQELAARPLVWTATINFDDAQSAVFMPPTGSVILDAKVWDANTFDAGTTNQLAISRGSRFIPGGGALTPFAFARDLTLLGGTPVTGYTNLGVDTDPFLPWLVASADAIYVGYSQSGTAATQGQALIYITYLSG